MMRASHGLVACLGLVLVLALRPLAARGEPGPVASARQGVEDEAALKAELNSLIGARRNSEARAVAERLLSTYESTLDAKDPKIGSVLEVLMLLYSAEKDWPKALAAALRALEIEQAAHGAGGAKAGELHRMVSGIYRHSRDTARATEHAERALEIFEKLGTSDRVWQVLHELERLYTEASDEVKLLACVNRIARSLAAAARYGEAVPRFQRALALEQKLHGRNSDQVAVISSNLALAYANVGEHAKAEQLYRGALALVERKKGPDHPEVAQILSNLAGTYDDTDQPQRALPLYERALAIRKLGNDKAEIALAEQDLALARQRLGDYAGAEAGYSRSFALLEAAGATETEDAAQVLGNWASLHSEQGDFAGAELLGRRALALAERLFGPDDGRSAHPANNLGDFCKQLGKLDEAERLYRRAHDIWSRTLGPAHPLVGLSLNNLGALYLARGDFARARDHVQRALAVIEKAQGAGHSAAATALNNLANIELDSGNFVEAEPLLERARDAFEKALGPDHPLVATALNNLGVLKLQLGNSKGAEADFTRALGIVEKLGDRRAIAKTRLNLAVLYDRRNDIVRAEPMFRRALALLEGMGPDVPDLAPALLGLGSVLAARGEYAEAEVLLSRARAIARAAEGEGGPGVAKIDGSLAHLVADQGRYAQAEALYARAIGALERLFGDDHPDVAQLYANQALRFWEQGKRESAVAAMQRSVETRERHVSRTLATGSEEQRRMLISSTSPEIDWAVDLHEHGFPGDERAKRLALLAVLRSKGRLSEVMQDTTRALRDHLGPGEQQLFDRLKDVRTRIARLVFASGTNEERERSRAALAPLVEEADELESRIAARSALFRSVAQPVTIEQVAAQLPADTALVEVVSHLRYDLHGGPLTSWRERRYSAYLLKPDQSVSYVELGPADAIDPLVAAFRAAVRDKTADPMPRARELDERVMRPIRRLAGNIRNLIVSADGSLNLVPFGALVDERHHYLIDDWSIRYLSTGRELLRPSSGPSRTAALVVADPTFDAPATSGRTSAALPSSAPKRRLGGVIPKFDRLPGTLDEGQAVARSLDVALLSGSDASVGALLGLKGPRILHVATHGFFFGDERQAASGRGIASGPGKAAGEAAAPVHPLLRSGLALAGANLSGSDDVGILTALEASSLDLWGTRLVVLSACDTGVGTVSNREGVYGLRRALTLAGADSLVMSLWRVDDSATRDLMIAYYERLSNGGNRSSSLRDVQLSMRRSASRAHPYYWASFISLGAEGPLGESPELPPALPGLGSTPPPAQPLGAARGCGCRLGEETSSGSSRAWLGSLLFAGVLLARRRARVSQSCSGGSPSTSRASRSRRPRSDTRSIRAAAG